jgi:hypothetical protein
LPQGQPNSRLPADRVHDLGCNVRLPNLADLQARGCAIYRRILEAERVGQGTVLASQAFERITHPRHHGRAEDPALRFGDPRVIALAGALSTNLLAATGITNKPARLDDRTPVGSLDERRDVAETGA